MQIKMLYSFKGPPYMYITLRYNFCSMYTYMYYNKVMIITPFVHSHMVICVQYSAPLGRTALSLFLNY